MTTKEIRASTGLSQRNFCSALEIPSRLPEEWGAGNRCPPPYLVKLIAYRVNTDPTFQRKTPKGGEAE